MKQISTFLTVVTVAILFIGCGGDKPNTATNNNAVANTGNSNNPLETVTPTPEQTINNAPTLTPVFKAYCNAWVKNDEAALRKVYSAETIKQFEAEMKEENAKSLIKYLEATDKVSGDPCEVTNEIINGDKAVGRIKSNKYKNGIVVEFVKENGEWKLTNKSPSLNDMKPSTSTATNPPANAPAPDAKTGGDKK
ncbi:MAG: hypothetical protein ACKVQW_04680 [Pyrinomonadaceae bacterium]